MVKGGYKLTNYKILPRKTTKQPEKTVYLVNNCTFN